MRICIIGGGVVGLNIAYKLAGGGDEIYLLEKEPYLGHHTSTRNSEVIHAGFAYPSDSLKAKFCLSGNPMTYTLLDKLGVPYKRYGKWIIACGEGDIAALDATFENAKKCNVPEFNYADVNELLKIEPDIHSVTKVIFSASSGIMDSAAYIKALEVTLFNCENVNLIFPCKVIGVEVATKTVETDRGSIEYDVLINSAGLWADDVFDMTAAENEKGRYKIVPFKGEYYTWRKGRIKTMIYPVPRRFLSAGNVDQTLVSSMGIHTHRNIAGDLFLGPSQIDPLVSVIPAEAGIQSLKDNYKIINTAAYFAENVLHYLKGVKAEDLEPAYAGNRPKLYIDGHPFGDYKIWREENIIHLLGMESPALTSAPAIAEYVADLLKA